MKTEYRTENIILPEGVCRYTCCAECSAGDYDSKREQVYCGKYRRYFDRSDGCSNGPDG